MEYVEINGIGIFRSENFYQHNIVHGFTTKKNVGFDGIVFPSKPSLLNYETLFKFASKLGLENKRFVFQEQVHSNNIKIIDSNDLSSEEITVIPKNDGLMTNVRDVCLVSLSADCLSVLLSHPQSGAIANAHAGRKGAMLQIVPKLVFNFCMEFEISPREVLVALGTSISATCYEVKDDVVDEIKKVEPNAFGFLINRHGKRFFDLRGYICQSLVNMGISPENIDSQTLCSHCNEDLFFSYRRDGRVIGSQAAFIST